MRMEMDIEDNTDATIMFLPLMNILGDRGWELVSEPTYLFKCRKP